MRSSLPLPSAALRVWLAVHPEVALVAALLLLALLVRVIGLDRIEPNIQADEADRLQLLYRWQAGHSLGIFDVAPDGNPSAAYYPALLFLKLFGPSYVSLRLSSAFGSMLILAVFFLLARRSLGFFASFGATALLAFSGWLLYFSRNGELTVWVALCMLAAAYFTRRALELDRWRDWRYAGLFCGLGWYTEMGGMLILPIILLYLGLVAALDPTSRRAAGLGGLVVVLVAVAVLSPRLPALVANLGLIEQSVKATIAVGPVGQPRATFPNQLLISLRAFVLLDPSLPGNSRYVMPGAPLIDSFSGTLFFVGLFLSLAHLRESLLWWCLFAPTVLLLHSLSRGIPDAARALPGLPAMMLFAGLTIDRLERKQYLGQVARLLLAIGVPAAAFWNCSHYVEWQQSPGNAVARQPAVEVAEFPIWQTLQLAAAETDEPGFDVVEWQRLREQYRPAIVAAGGTTAGNRVAAGLEARLLPDFGPVEGLRKPRGVAADAAGIVYVLESDGRVLKLGGNGKTVATLGTATGGPQAEGASDLDIGPDGSLFVLDAARGQIDRYGPDGRFAATLGAGWGMYRPRGLAVGKDGKIYVADTGRNRVVISGGGEVEKSLPDVEQPTDVAIDPAGRIYVAQPEASKLSVLEPEGRPIATWEISRSNTVEGPHLAYLEAGAVALTDPPKHRVRLLDTNGRELAQVGGENDPTLGLPYAAATTGQRLYVVDAGKPAVRAFEVDTR